EVRRRPRATGGLRSANVRTGRCEGCRDPRGLPEPGRAALVHRRDIPQPDAPPRDRIAFARGLCRSIPLPEAGARVKVLMTGTDGYIGSVMADVLMGF